MTALELFGEWLADGHKPRLSPDLQKLLGLHVADTVGAWVASAHTQEGRRILAYRNALARECAGASLEIAIHCAVTRLSEIDDIHLASMITPGSIVVPAALAMAAALSDAEPAALNNAILAGYEAIVRFGLVIDGPAVSNRGIWPTYFGAAFGVAATASRLLKLDASQSAHALALALTLSSPGVGLQDAVSMSRWLAAGLAARNGLQAATAAQAGFTSDPSLLEGNYFRGIYNITPNVAALTEGLRERLILQDVAFKPWAAARQTMAATQAFRELLATGVKADGIEAVEIAVPPPFLRMVDHGIGARMSRLTSLPYQIAIAALDPEAAFDVGQQRQVPAAVEALMAKVKVAADESLMTDFPKVWHARVRVNAGDQWYERAGTDASGNSVKPFDKSDVRKKFRRTGAGAVGAEACDGLIDLSLAVIDGTAKPTQLLAKIAAALPV